MSIQSVVLLSAYRMPNCVWVRDTANHRSDEAHAGVELIRPGVTADVHINK